jgi:Flp pilus assembly protein TadG
MVRKLFHKEGAQSLAEFALVMPFFLILVFGIIDFGLGLRAYISLASATREGARYAAVGNPAGTSFTSGNDLGQCTSPLPTPTNTTVRKVCATINGLDLDNVDSVSVTYPSGQLSGNSVKVTANYQYHYITPVHGIVNVLSGGAMPSSLTISSSSDMRLE